MDGLMNDVLEKKKSFTSSQLVFIFQLTNNRIKNGFLFALFIYKNSVNNIH